MGINLYCKTCKSSLSLQTKICPKCGSAFTQGKRYRVVVKGSDGRRVTKLVDTLNMAKNLEAKLKTQSMEKKLLGIRSRIGIDEAWDKYILWAEENKKSWMDDKQRWEKHVLRFVHGKTMDSVAPLDVDKVISTMKKSGYAPQTIKHVLNLIKRVYNWAILMDLYSGDNPAKRTTPPKCENHVTECLTKDEIKSLLNTLDAWNNKMVALVIKFALYTGCRRGEVFSLRWNDVSFATGTITLKDTKGGQDTTLPISRAAIEILRDAKAIQAGAGYQWVFPNRRFWGRL
ncbi:Site-specific recombinase XerD [Desulfatibacillum alkenivorans DSM 16219]|uniref:Site-specific recombinase XerD n=1 Tax=Desulfatibacillum alkenivorans DSM 16219 TaxID=1121393 RepID=A0A1M6M1C4_9BACT|nr:integrase [Desulfatibacillum alkenivorans]SHJ77248.1 Site-specific recombinase XerD [Desulfatibacillum alkenivorans DSM 16219]